MKYIIEIEEEPFWRQSALYGEEGLYRANGFKSLVFDQLGLDKLTPLDKELDEAYQKGFEAGQHEATTLEYQQGLNDAWETIIKLAHTTYAQRSETFDGLQDILSIMQKFSPSEVTAKIKAYEQREQEIKVGDEVMNTLGTMDNAVGYFFGDSSDGCYKVLRYVDGKFKTGIWNKENCERTGKHSYAVERMVAVLKKGAE